MLMARPSSYRKEYAEKARTLCEMGATDMELAEFFRVDVRTIYNWRHSHPEFFQAVHVGKDALDDRVERSLYQRAVGYSFNSQKLFHFQGKITRADTIEHVAPDPGAALNWLKNRRRDTWRDKQEHEHSGALTVVIRKPGD
jgi:hypothetical protein